MKIPLRAWAEKHFSVAVSNTTLTSYAKSGQISPCPVKFAGRWVVDEDARFVGMSAPPVSTDPLVMRILNHGQKAHS